jgi:hypothetical protein
LCLGVSWFYLTYYFKELFFKTNLVFVAASLSREL